jgi:flagellar hook protein FlgE
LNKVGNNDFTFSSNVGESYTGQAGHGGLGLLQSGTLEGSNVDLAVELANMIVAQRSFDTNARVMAVINETLDVTTRLGQGG